MTTINDKVYMLLAAALADAVGSGDLNKAVHDAYDVFTTLDASKALIHVSLFSRGGVVDGVQVGEGEDRIVRYCGKTIGTRYLVGDKFHEHIDVHAASHDPACVHPSEADVLELLRSGELGSHYLLLDPTPSTK